MNNTGDNPYLKTELKKQDSFLVGKAIYNTVSEHTLSELYSPYYGFMNDFYEAAIEITPFRPSLNMCKRVLQPIVHTINILMVHDFSSRSKPEEYFNIPVMFTK